MTEFIEISDYIEDLYQEILLLAADYMRGKKTGGLNRLTIVKKLKELERLLLIMYDNILKFKEPTIENDVNKMKQSMDEIKYLINTNRIIRQRYKNILNARNVSETNHSGIIINYEKGYKKGAYWLIYCLSNPFYNFVEKGRYIFETRIFPDKIRTDVYNMLVEYKFTEVIEALELIDENLIQNHFKDCVDNCRKSIMKTVEYLNIKIGKTPRTSFEGNLSILVDNGIIDVVEKRDYVTFFSTLSQRSQHEMIGDELTLTPADCIYLIDMTYARLKRLLYKFQMLQT